MLPEIAESITDLPRRITKARNDLAHHLAKKAPPPLRARALEWLVVSEVTSWVLRCLLLLRAGFEPEDLRERLLLFQRFGFFRANTAQGTVTLIEKFSGAVGFEAVATEHRWVVHISGGSVGRGDLTPDREAVGHLGSPFDRAEQMPPRPEVCGDAAEGGQEPLRMPRRFDAFHRPFALSGGLMRVLGTVQIPRPPVLHRRHELAVSDLVAAQLVGDQHPRHLPQALAQLTEESLGRHRVSA